MRPALAEIVGEGRTKIQGALQRLEAVSKSLALQGCFEKPLRLFDAGPVQIKMLDPIFHEEGDRPLTREWRLRRRSSCSASSTRSGVLQRVNWPGTRRWCNSCRARSKISGGRLGSRRGNGCDS